MKIDRERLERIGRASHRTPGETDEHGIELPVVSGDDVSYLLSVVSVLIDILSALWPFVRYFGLCGADTRAVEAVARVSQVLELETPAVDAISLRRDAMAAKAEQIAQWLEEGDMHRKIPRQYRKEIVDAVRAMKG